MLWNFLLHIGIGVFGVAYFPWTTAGFVNALMIAGVLQAIDMVRVYSSTKERIESNTSVVREEQMRIFKERAPYTMPQLYLFKVLLYSGVTFLAAATTRAMA